MNELDKKERFYLSGIFFLTIFFIGVDIIEDLEAGSSLDHVLKEGFIVAIGLVGFLSIWYRYFKIVKTAKRLKGDVSHLQSDISHYKADLAKYKEETKSLIEGLAVKIDAQLERWGLTKAEKDVALMILKGLTNAEIAHIRNSSESTVRGQINSLFKKSNLHSRAELAAYFLEDLLVIS